MKKTLKQTSKAITAKIPCEKGDLPFLVFFQSLNGHPDFRTYATVDEANRRFDELKALGLKPEVYLLVRGGFPPE
jgi:hypothetical protein